MIASFIFKKTGDLQMIFKSYCSSLLAKPELEWTAQGNQIMCAP